MEKESNCEKKRGRREKRNLNVDYSASFKNIIASMEFDSRRRSFFILPDLGNLGYFGGREWWVKKGRKRTFQVRLGAFMVELVGDLLRKCAGRG